MFPMTGDQVRVIAVLSDEFPMKFVGAMVGGVQATIVETDSRDSGPNPFEFHAMTFALIVCPASYPRVVMKLVIGIIHQS